MPFMLHQLRSDGLHFVRNLSLAGKRGPLYARMLEAEKETGWHMDDAEILHRLGVEHAEAHRFVIDLKPDASGHVSLYRLRDVWGFRHSDWCPLALRLTAFYSDHPVDDIHAFKRRFDVPKSEGPSIHEFLYLQGSNGRWTWGRTGGVNGPLLWPSSLEFFIENIAKGMGWQFRRGGRS